MLIHTPTAGDPKIDWPTASARPCPGGYIDAYEGWTMMWNDSKCSQNGGVGLASRPCEKVSAASK